MRLDKFLKVSRLIKRRTVAKAVVEGGRVRVNGREAKPATPVTVGDRIEIDTPWGLSVVVVERLKETVPAKEAPTLYRVERWASPRDAGEDEDGS
ncbi:MAG: RNA-binding S4 domain-containing protein [Actinomycetia bacterium]|nr:RNA-binding S4 domain-containing protein [Actinomycetes bacterium]